jgi:soluble lytic murein transglycosylase-like protein
MTRPPDTVVFPLAMRTSKRRSRSILPWTLAFFVFGVPLLGLLSLLGLGESEKQADLRYNTLIRAAGDRYEIDPTLIRAVIWRESDFNPDARGLAGEFGLMQVTPVAGQEWAKAEKIENFRPTDLLDPGTNIQAGAWYLARARKRWNTTDNPTAFALAEYNAGRSNALRWSALDDPTLASAVFIERIDYPTTKTYVLDILDQQHRYQAEPDPPLWQRGINKLRNLWSRGFKNSSWEAPVSPAS